MIIDMNPQARELSTTGEEVNIPAKENQIIGSPSIAVPYHDVDISDSTPSHVEATGGSGSGLAYFLVLAHGKMISAVVVVVASHASHARDRLSNLSEEAALVNILPVVVIAGRDIYLAVEESA